MENVFPMLERLVAYNANACAQNCIYKHEQ